MELVNILGVISSLALGLCGIPQLVHTVKTKKADDISWLFLLLWYGGEWGMFVYTIIKVGYDLPLLMNYCLNLVIISVIIKIKLESRPES